MTGEDWNALMYDVMRDNAFAGLVYMCIFFVLANYVLMEVRTLANS